MSPSASAQTKAAEEIAARAEVIPLPVVEHETIAEALVAALSEIAVIEKHRTANAGTYSYDYAGLDDVTLAIRRVLARHGVIARTPVHDHDKGLAVTVTFLHRSGTEITDEPLPFPPGANAQATGSAITYFRRYALLASCGVATGEDDDGAKAAQAPAFQWTVGAVKARLIELLGDKEKASEAWRLGGGEDEPPSKELADRLAADWLGNQPKDEPPAETKEGEQ